MTEFYDEVNELVNDILAYKATRDEAEARINEMKRKYGADAFPGIHFKAEPKPWDKKYLQKLKAMNITGACSEEFLLHMAEVSEAVSAGRKKLLIGLGILPAALVAAGIVLFIF